MSHDSCLVTHFQHYASLDSREIKLLEELEDGAEDYPAHSAVIEQGAKANDVFIVNHGWCYAFQNLPGGGRQILEVYIPGDLVAVREACFTRAITGIYAVTDAELCKMGRDEIPELMDSSTRLGSILLMMNMLREAHMIDRLVSLGRRDAKESLARLLLTTKHRRAITHTLDAEWSFPFKGKDIGDMLGLSEVHVSRVISELRRAAVVDIRRGKINILDYDALKNLADYNAAYFEVDKSWLPT